MTVAALPATVDYLEDGVTLSFPAPFRFKAASDLIVARILGGAVLPLALGTDYSVTGGATDAGGTVTRTVATAGATLRIRRRTARTQPMIYSTGDRFPAKSHEEALDRQMLIAQELDASQADTAARAIMLPPGETAAPLPPRQTRIGGGKKILAIDQDTGAVVVEAMDIAYRGGPGTSNNTRLSIAELKAAPTSDGTSLFDGSIFTWTAGDFTGRADDANIVKADGVALAQGAWVRGIEAAASPASGAAGLVAAGTITGTVSLKPGTYDVGNGAAFGQGLGIRGTSAWRGAGTVQGTGAAAALRFSAVGGDYDLNGPALSDFTVFARAGVAIGDRTLAIGDGGGQSVFHYGLLQRLNVLDRSLTDGIARTDASIGVSFSKVFNTGLQFSEILGFRIGVLLNGSDINAVTNNRIYGWDRYGILETSTTSFGSQNTIRENDILGSPTTANGAAYKSSGRHVSLFNNYFEPQGAMAAGAGFVDVSPLAIPAFGGNPPAKALSIWIDGNRVDSQGLASYVYRLDAGEARTVVVRGRQTSDGSSTPSRFIDGAGNVQATLPMHVGQRARNMEIAEVTFGPIWHGHRDEPEVSIAGGRLAVTARNKAAFPFLTPVTGRDAYVRHEGDFLVIPPGNANQPIPIFPGYGANKYFGDGVNWKVTVFARSTAAGDDIMLQQAGLNSDGAGFGTAYETKAIGKSFRAYTFLVPGRPDTYQACGLHIQSSTSIGTIYFYVAWEEQA